MLDCLDENNEKILLEYRGTLEEKLFAAIGEGKIKVIVENNKEIVSIEEM